MSRALYIEGSGAIYYSNKYCGLTPLWTAKEEVGHGSTAGVELLEPTKTLQQLYVKKSEYILRQPLQITNLDLLLTTNNPF